MKKTFIILGIILSTGIAALSLNKKTEAKPIGKVDKTELSNKSYTGDFKSDIANAD